ncbi:hypothetical protein AJ80_00082 [Polytolypa hystricis UAMH7299]|uniref:Uncharacterized protein n=1 Tax=Polytolypa hystricis (strain UAMH7299) TaxID=1447883 RepID=A0A2B7Z579_POLH7|nr:hypothetical protein AJ80_00082 [Polytolypa hystricis UAMH7299]
MSGFSSSFSSSSPSMANGHSQLLTFSPSPYDSGAKLIHRQDPHGNAIPVYSFTKSPDSKPNIHLSRVSPGAVLYLTVIGHITLHSISSKIDLSLHGDDMSEWLGRDEAGVLSRGIGLN